MFCFISYLLSSGEISIRHVLFFRVGVLVWKLEVSVFAERIDYLINSVLHSYRLVSLWVAVTFVQLLDQKELRSWCAALLICHCL